uniref:17-beta-hydroxysteroid dehydrogenase 13-like n=1 Tax=Hirondellea gigas TaxID=1518452 RepID=A0A2P2IBN4_9CRUS
MDLMMNIYHFLLDIILLNLQIVAVLLLDIYGIFVPPMEKSLRNKIILITGGGGRLAREMALQMALMGSQLVLCDINEPELQESGRVIQEADGEVALYRCDITKHEQVSEMARRVGLEVGDPWMVINCAEACSEMTLLEHSTRDVQNTVDVNLMGTMWLTRSFLGSMVSSNSGHVVFISSVLGVVAHTRLAPFCASNFAVTGFSESLSDELRDEGIDGVTVTLVHHTTVRASGVPAAAAGHQHRNKRLLGLFDGMSPAAAASAIIAGIRINQEEIFLPRKLKPITRIYRCLPHSVRRVFKSYLESS